jgi:hypothetical protein
MSNKIAVTVCTASHLAQAKALGDSLLRYNSGYKLVIGLADKLDGRVPAGYYYPHELIEARELNIPQFDEMIKRYTLLELSCALKYFFTGYCLKKYNAKKIVFFDSDIAVFDSLHFIEDQLEEFSILITPHITSPYPDDSKRPVEKEMLKNGIFNAGFFAFRWDENGQAFLNWFKNRMIDQCFVRPKEGLNADQSWFNFVPVYFGSVKTLYHPGCNVAYWNLHERKVSKQGEKYFVNNESLIFFHYSGYSVNHPEEISRHQDRISFEGNNELRELFQVYHTTLINNHHERMLSLRCYYQKGSDNIFKKFAKK